MKTQTIKQIFAITFLVMLLSFGSALTIENVDSTPSEIAPGQDASIKLSIENELGIDLEDIMVSLDLSQVPFAPYQSGSDRIIEELDDEDKESVDFEIIALSEAEAGIYKIPVIFSYYYNDSLISKTSFISLTINSEPELDISYEGDLIKGRKNEVNIKITNTGLTEVKFLEVELKDSTNIKVLSSKQVYIGDIESDDFDSVDFDLFINENVGSYANLPVKLNYRDATNNIKTENINLNLKTYTEKEAIELGLIKNNKTTTYVIAFIVMIVLWFVYRNLSKKVKKKNGK